MEYIKHGTPFTSYSKRGKLNQCFLHNPKQVINVNNITALYLDHKIDDNDLELLRFIWQAQFSVQEQINRYSLAHNIGYVQERLENLFKNHIIHKFFLYSSDSEKGQLPGDAEIYFCLAEGGRHLIASYIDEYIVWNLSNISLSGSMIARSLIDTELWLDVMFGAENLEVMEYQKAPRFYVNKDDIVLNSNYLFKVEGRNYYMVTDVIGSTNEMLRLRPRIRLIGQIFESKIWRKYYPDTSMVPMLLFIVDTDEDAAALAKEVAMTTRIKPENFRLTTWDRMKEGIGTDKSFIYYDNESKEIYETGIDIFK